MEQMLAATTSLLQRLVTLASEEARTAGAEALEPIHLWTALCRNPMSVLARLLRAQGLDPARIAERSVLIGDLNSTKVVGGPRRVSSRVVRVFNAATAGVAASGRPVGEEHVVLALLRAPDHAVRMVIDTQQIRIDRLIEELEVETSRRDAVPPIGDAAGYRPPSRHRPTVMAEPFARVNVKPAPAAPPQPASSLLDRIGRDYSALARQGKLDPVIGRTAEIKQVVRVLLRKQKSNPCLVGEPGVGKTAVVEGLALRAATPDGPPGIRRLRIVEVPVGSLVAGLSGPGEFEARLQRLVEEVRADPNVVVFFDEIHTLVGAGVMKPLDAANILKPALARGWIRCIGATTPAEYRRYVESDGALERRFQPIRVEEPTPGEAKAILAGLRSTYEVHHRVALTDEALAAAVDLSVRYLPDRRLPDKARDLIDQAAAAARFITFSPTCAAAGTPRVGAEDVARIVSEWTGIPLERLTGEGSRRLLRMEEALRRRVIGQDEAVAAVAAVVRKARAGLASPRRPQGVFLFLGPSGVGKTELARALAEFIFGDEQALLRFDMSEYVLEHHVSRLIGAPPGYVGFEQGGKLTEAVRRRPHCVILFDEVEKAHPSVFEIFLQIFDDGRLTDGQNRTVDFRNAIVILTSNIRPPEGARRRGGRVGFRATGPTARSGRSAAGEFARRVPQAVRDALLERFRPELLNRIGRVVEFRPLEPGAVRAVIEKTLREVRQRLSEQRIALAIDEDALDLLADLGHDLEQGVRNLEHVVEARIVEPLAAALLDGTFEPGCTVRVLVENDEFVLARENGASRPSPHVHPARRPGRRGTDPC
jgi:ATP-dependent Clp protease ATP-binding subunit ClpC